MAGSYRPRAEETLAARFQAHLKLCEMREERVDQLYEELRAIRKLILRLAGWAILGLLTANVGLVVYIWTSTQH